VLGPADGRYVLRGHAGEPEYVLVLETIGAEPHRRRARRRDRRARSVAPGPPPSTVPVSCATLVAAVPLSEDAALQWLSSVDLADEVQAAVAVLNGVLHAERIVRADPFVREIASEQALTIRVGIGQGEEVARGRWTEARALPPTVTAAPRRVHALRPQERFAALLAGRDVALAAEELTLRARLDLDRGRSREAALQLRVALEAALAELQAWSHHAEMTTRLDELRAERDTVAAAANRALEGGLDAEQVQDIARVLRRVEAALTARVAGGYE
jgi:hypothetical protein